MTAAGRERRLAAVPPPAPDPRLAAAEARRRAALEEVDALDAQVERLARELAEFSFRYERGLVAGYAELERAERLVHRIQVLEEPW